MQKWSKMLKNQAIITSDPIFKQKAAIETFPNFKTVLSPPKFSRIKNVG